MNKFTGCGIAIRKGAPRFVVHLPLVSIFLKSLIIYLLHRDPISVLDLIPFEWFECRIFRESVNTRTMNEEDGLVALCITPCFPWWNWGKLLSNRQYHCVLGDNFWITFFQCSLFRIAFIVNSDLPKVNCGYGEELFQEFNIYQFWKQWSSRKWVTNSACLTSRPIMKSFGGTRLSLLESENGHIQIMPKMHGTNEGSRL